MHTIVEELKELSDKYGQDVFMDEQRVISLLQYDNLPAGQIPAALKGLALHLYYKFIYFNSLTEVNYLRFSTIRDYKEKEGMTTAEAEDAVDCWLAVAEYNKNVKILSKLDSGEVNKFLVLRQALQSLSEKQLDKAFRQLNLLETERVAEASYHLGLWYYTGEYAPKDCNTAFLHFEKGAKEGSSNAKYMLAVCYGEGKGVEHDQAKSLSYYDEAALMGNELALYELGSMYMDGTAAVPKNILKALERLLKAAKEGNGDAQRKLGQYYISPENTAANQTLGVAWLKRAASRIDPVPDFLLGSCYETGLGVEKNIKEAISWYIKAASKGYAEAGQKAQSLLSEL